MADKLHDMVKSDLIKSYKVKLSYVFLFHVLYDLKILRAGGEKVGTTAAGATQAHRRNGP